MLIPIDFYRILGVPPQTDGETIEQAYQDRLLQLPRREFSDDAVTVRNQILAIAYGTLQDPEQRNAYDLQWWGEELANPELAIAVATPEFECNPEQLIGALLILLDLGEYELVLRYGEPPIPDSGGIETSLDEDQVLVLTLAHWELSRESWQRQQYELAAAASLKALARLGWKNSFPSLEKEIREELYKLRPYRILELLTRQEPGTEARQQGLDLLQEVIQDRGGIEGRGEDHSGLGNDDFLKFVQQLRCHLTIAEQINLFLPESQRPSAIARYLAVHGLIAQGLHQRQPVAIVEAKSVLDQLENCQDLILEKAICELLLGQTEAVILAVGQKEPKIVAALGEELRVKQDPLTAFYAFADDQWLTEQIMPYFRGLNSEQLSLAVYFDDLAVQQYLEQFEPNSHTHPNFYLASSSSPSPESDTPMVHSSASLTDHPAPMPVTKRRSRSQRRSRHNVAESVAPTSAVATIEPPTADLLSLDPELEPHISNGLTDTLAPDPRPGKRRRKKRVTINPVRFGIFLVSTAAVFGGVGFLAFSLNSSPLADLAADPLDIALGQPLALIPDDATTQSLLVSQPEFSKAVGQEVVQNWLEGKKLAFSQDHDLKVLENVLAPALLARQQARARRDQQAGIYHQYQHKLEILDYRVNSPKGDRAMVTARVQEISQPFSLKDQKPKGKGTEDNLKVTYQLLRDRGIWKIEQIQVN